MGCLLGGSPLAPPFRIGSVSEVLKLALKSQFENRCVSCGGYIKVGDDIKFFPPVNGMKGEAHHVVCPEKKPLTTRTREPARQIDHDELFDLRKCSREPVPYDPNVRWTRGHMNVCGKVFSFPKGSRIPPRCPECEADWASHAFWEAA